MNLPDLAIKRPVFITCCFVLIALLGALSITRLGVDTFPDVSFPIVVVSTTYPGAAPSEIETLVSKPIEESVGTLSGIKTIRSTNKESISLVIVEFTLDTDVKYAEQQVRDRIATVKPKLPDDAEEPIIKTVNPSDQPILILALSADMPPAELYDLADQSIRPLLEQVKDVGQVEIVGARKREIQVLLDRKKLKARELSASQVATQLAMAGTNIPAGKTNFNGQEIIIRTLGEYDSLDDIRSTLINFYGNETPTQIKDVAEVRDGLEDEESRTFINGKQALTLYVYRRSGANTIAVVDMVKTRISKINQTFTQQTSTFDLAIVRDGSNEIRANVLDVAESIALGILLTITVVFLFLGNARSTFITGIALPNSLLGAFILMMVAGFTVNIMTLLAMSLAVGLLIDDAIVVRENIFRHIQLGKSPREAASLGTREVALAVIATTFTVIAVFGPVAFLQGVVGQFFKEFGLTICFAMLISLLDAFTMAPMLSAYLAGRNAPAVRRNFISRGIGYVTDSFERGQTHLENFYVKTLHFTLRWPLLVLSIALAIFVFSFFAIASVPKTFLPPADTGEFMVTMDMPPGTDLQQTNKVADAIDRELRQRSEVTRTVMAVGGNNGEPNEANIYVQLVPRKMRSMNTSEFKEIARGIVAPYAYASPKVQDPTAMGEDEQPFNVSIIGEDLQQTQKIATDLYEHIKNHPDLKDVDISYRPGKPELRVVLDQQRAKILGVSTQQLGQELRTHIEGSVPAMFRANAHEYDIRVRLLPEQRNLKENFSTTYVPNFNNRLIKLSDVAKSTETDGPATIYRQDRGRYIQVSAELNPDGLGMARAIADVKKYLSTGETKVPPNIRYEFVGQAENFEELNKNISIAMLLAVIFIYFVLASLYESFITPFTIMLVLPLAICGAFYGLAITGSSLDIFSMIGTILLLGIATKNSILLVDYIKQMTDQGESIAEGIIAAGKTRLRPIIMTSVALIAGMLPVAIGLNEASSQRTSMGIAVIGGLISSTVLTLVVVPAAYIYIERFRLWSLRFFSKFAPE
ncbi:MAG: efflux RND transporter permease subunit [Gammaproteobacteria bacterium]|nr:efflux RND transporter permease subunit [Gammaproteobacteria bacterium]